MGKHLYEADELIKNPWTRLRNLFPNFHKLGHWYISFLSYSISVPCNMIKGELTYHNCSHPSHLGTLDSGYILDLLEYNNDHHTETGLSDILYSYL